ncbi:hypothetical protein [Pseudomonas sp. Hp2]|uniref:hypothetical protein n=1 Tax=Pseudomonas sp. Hp2 TaxID=701189 RepID=UPI001126C2B4|nr:hypothetical protein [Pseudomonas sp. Hp2]
MNFLAISNGYDIKPGNPTLLPNETDCPSITMSGNGQTPFDTSQVVHKPTGLLQSVGSYTGELMVDLESEY